MFLQKQEFPESQQKKEPNKLHLERESKFATIRSVGFHDQNQTNVSTNITIIQNRLKGTGWLATSNKLLCKFIDKIKPL